MPCGELALIGQESLGRRCFPRQREAGCEHRGQEVGTGVEKVGSVVTCSAAGHEGNSIGNALLEGTSCAAAARSLPASSAARPGLARHVSAGTAEMLASQEGCCIR